jgi:hypothetical protein
MCGVVSSENCSTPCIVIVAPVDGRSGLANGVTVTFLTPGFRKVCGTQTVSLKYSDLNVLNIVSIRVFPLSIICISTESKFAGR